MSDFNYRTGEVLKPKKRNPNDSTFRNINALKTRVSALERECKSLRTELNDIRFGRKRASR